MFTAKKVQVVKDPRTGRSIQWQAKSTLSSSGSVSISAGDALQAEVVKAQLEAVKRIRESVAQAVIDR